MRLKDIIASLETFQIDQKTGHQIIGNRPDIPTVIDERIIESVIYINHDEMTDHKLLNTAKSLIAQYGNLRVIQKAEDLTSDMDQLTADFALLKEQHDQAEDAAAQQIKELEDMNAELVTEKEAADAEANDQIAKLQGEIKGLRSELAKAKKALKAAQKDEE